METKLCRKCGIEKATGQFFRHKKNKDGLQAYCKKCTGERAKKYRRSSAEAMKKFRASAKGKEWIRAYKKRFRLIHADKQKAHQRVTWARHTGKLIPQPCEVCGATDRLEAHHDDYSKPMVVRWLCRPHHVAHHQSLKSVVL